MPCLPPRFVPTAIALTVLAMLAGCVDRKERITIGDDGTVDVEIDWTADTEQELFAGRVPADGAGWTITRSKREAEAEAPAKHLLTARRRFAPGTELPWGFFPAGDAYADTYLEHPTTLRIEAREDGIYYHFHRVYPGRPWQQVDALRRDLLRAYELSDDDLRLDIPHGQRATVLRMLAEVEIRKALVFARRAWLEMEPAPQDAWLDLRARVLLSLETLDFDHLDELLTAIQQGEDAIALEIEARRFEATVRGAIADAAASAGLDATERAEFDERLAWHSRYHGITEGLASEQFTINVVMPGEIIGSNADRQRGSTATWKFGGDAIRDRDIELMVTSRVR